VKNEPDHPANIGGYDNWDSNPAARDKIVSWLNRICNAVRAIDANHPVSAGLRWWRMCRMCCHSSTWQSSIRTGEHRHTGNPGRKGLHGCKPEAHSGGGVRCRESRSVYRDGQWIYIYDEAEQLNVYANHLTAIQQHDTAAASSG